MKRKFDVKTAKKLLSTYAEKITFYMQENELLKSHLRDLETTLQINKDILSTYIQNTSTPSSSIIPLLQSEISHLTLCNNSLYKDKLSLEKKLYTTQQELTEANLKLRSLESKDSNDLFMYQNNLKEKDNIILH